MAVRFVFSFFFNRCGMLDQSCFSPLSMIYATANLYTLGLGSSNGFSLVRYPAIP
jgi:hypothetical protein